MEDKQGMNQRDLKYILNFGSLAEQRARCDYLLVFSSS